MEKSAIKDSRSLGPAIPGLIALFITAAFLFLPFAGAFIAALLPAPVAFSRFRDGASKAVLASLVCIAFTGAITSSYLLAAVIACLCVSDFAMGDSLAKGGRDDLAVLKGALAPFVLAVPAAAVYFISRGTTPAAVIKRGLDISMQESLRIYRQMGMSQADIDALMPSLQMVVKIFTGYYPAIAAGALALSALVSYAVVKGRLVKGGQIPPSSVPVSMWQAPDYLVWGVIIPGFLMIPGLPVLRQASGNVLAVFALVYLFQGYAILTYLFERLKLSQLLRGIGLFLILIQPFLIAGLLCIGFFDTWVDFRKLRPKKVA